MKSDFLLAITQLSAEKNLPKDVVLTAVEAALVSAYKKDNFASNQNIAVKINPDSGKVEVWAEKNVVEVASDKRYEITLDEAKKVKHDVEIGDYSIVAAGCIVTEKMIVPEKSFVAGVPAKIKRELDTRQYWWSQNSPKIYVEWAQLYKNQGL